jgi:hypothetical protein
LIDGKTSGFKAHTSLKILIEGEQESLKRQKSAKQQKQPPLNNNRNNRQHMHLQGFEGRGTIFFSIYGIGTIFWGEGRKRERKEGRK